MGVRVGVRAQGPDTFAMYLGDDTSDEDAFRALEETGGGFGILVASRDKATAARLTLRDPGEVLQFLRRLEALLAARDAPGGAAAAR